MRRPVRILVLTGAVPFAVATVLGLAACTQQGSLPTLATPSSSTAAATPSPTPTEAALAVTDVATLAERTVGSGTTTAVEQEADATSWQVDVVETDGQVTELHLSSGGDLRAGPSSVPTDADQQSANRAAVAAATIDLEGAARRMVAAAPGGVVTAITLGRVGDRVAWIGDVVVDGVRSDVRIDAVNGAVLLNRSDAEETSGGS